ncbi:MAG: lactate utilization protein [Planctomycetes bacterium]|nr:lactate utilization protein [Planctomycetota bacterium]
MNLAQEVRTKLIEPGLSQKVQKAAMTAVRKRNKKAEDDPSWETARELARQIKLHTLTNLDTYLEMYVKNAEAAGVKVHFAKTAEDARAKSIEILKATGATFVNKAKSMVSEEIGLNVALAKAGLDPVETDLGEVICQLAGEPPSHVTAPALHKSIEDIARLFKEHNVCDIPEEIATLAGNYTQQERLDAASKLSLAAREYLRERFLTAKASTTGANFLIAETGALVLLSNEANIRLCTTVPKTIVSIVGIEKLIPSAKDLAVFLRLLAPSATGQKQTVYVSLLSGKTPGKDRHVILLDNGRSAMLGSEKYIDILSCIRCGACMNICPIYRQVGGHAYGSPYPGPIGNILIPFLHGTDYGKDHPFLSSLCMACSEVCPVKIPIADHLLSLRADMTSAGKQSWSKGFAMRMFAFAARRPRLFRLGGWFFRRFSGIASFVGPMRTWKKFRAPIKPAKTSFFEWLEDEGAGSREQGAEN